MRRSRAQRIAAVAAAAALPAAVLCADPLPPIRAAILAEMQLNIQKSLLQLARPTEDAALSLVAADTLMVGLESTDDAVAVLLGTCSAAAAPNRSMAVSPDGASWEVWCKPTGAAGFGQVQRDGQVVWVQSAPEQPRTAYVLSSTPGQPKFRWPLYGPVAVQDATHNALTAVWVTSAAAQSAQSTGCGIPTTPPVTPWVGCAEIQTPELLPLRQPGSSGAWVSAAWCDGGGVCTAGHLGTLAVRIEAAALREKLAAMQTRNAFGVGGVGFVVAANTTTTTSPATLFASSVGKYEQSDGSPLPAQNATWTAGDAVDLRCQIVASSGQAASGCSADAWQSGTVVSDTFGAITAKVGTGAAAQWQDMRPQQSSGIIVGTAAGIVDARAQHWVLSGSTLNLAQTVAFEASSIEAAEVAMPDGIRSAARMHAAVVLRDSTWTATNSLDAIRGELMWEAREAWNTLSSTQFSAVASIRVALAQAGVSLGSEANAAAPSTDKVVAALWALCETYPQHDAHHASGPQGQWWSVSCAATGNSRSVEVQMANVTGNEKRETFQLSNPPGTKTSKRWPDYGAATASANWSDPYAAGSLWGEEALPSANTALSAVWSKPYLSQNAVISVVSQPVCGSALSGSVTTHDTAQCTRFRGMYAAERKLSSFGADYLATLQGLGTGSRSFLANAGGEVLAASVGSVTCAANRTDTTSNGGYDFECNATDAEIAHAAAQLATNSSQLAAWMSSNGPASNTASAAYSSSFNISMNTTDETAAWLQVTPLAPAAGSKLPSSTAPLLYLCVLLNQTHFAGDQTAAVRSSLRRSVGLALGSVATTARAAMQMASLSFWVSGVILSELPATDPAVNALLRACTEYSASHFSHAAVSPQGDYYEGECTSLLATATGTAGYNSVGLSGRMARVQRRGSVTGDQPLKGFVLDALPGDPSSSTVAWPNYGSQAATDSTQYNATAMPWFFDATPARSNAGDSAINVQPEAVAPPVDVTSVMSRPVCSRNAGAAAGRATNYDGGSCARFTGLLTSNQSMLPLSWALRDAADAALGSTGAAFVMQADLRGSLLAKSAGEIPAVSTVPWGNQVNYTAVFPTPWTSGDGVTDGAAQAIYDRLNASNLLVNTSAAGREADTLQALTQLQLQPNGSVEGYHVDARRFTFPTGLAHQGGNPDWWLTIALRQEDFEQDQVHKLRGAAAGVVAAAWDLDAGVLWWAVSGLRTALNSVGITGGQIADTDSIVALLWHACRLYPGHRAHSVSSAGGYHYSVRCSDSAETIVIRHGGPNASVYASPTGYAPPVAPLPGSFRWPNYGAVVASMALDITTEQHFYAATPANNTALGGVMSDVRSFGSSSGLTLAAPRCSAAGATTPYDMASVGCTHFLGTVSADFLLDGGLYSRVPEIDRTLGAHGLFATLRTDPDPLVFVQELQHTCAAGLQGADCTRAVADSVQVVRRYSMGAGRQRGLELLVDGNDSLVYTFRLAPPTGTKETRGLLSCLTLRMEDWAGAPATMVPRPQITGAASPAVSLTAAFAAAAGLLLLLAQ
eukprot:TRINITY_DN20758_c0_g1_i1.p1 TRINITY_DN20758_c0_g1~~TRINITY_DN20758_c0_g1_i1.p1  ORF type:complete len:1568 (+),score=390.11 TRINITY_DN20758_c0_g1_i1:94-4704(+)